MTNEEFDFLKNIFLPPKDIPNRVNARPNPPIRLDREASDRVRKHRELGMWAATIVDGIAKDYERHMNNIWIPNIESAITAFDTALRNRDKYLNIAEKDRAARAAKDAFVLGLLATGALSFVGAYVSAVYLKNAVQSVATSQTDNNWNWIMQNVPRYSEFQQNAYGAFLGSTGGKLFELAYPTPTPIGTAELDWSNPGAVKARMKKDILASTNVMLQAFEEVKKWLNSSTPEFGEKWCAFSGTTERARQADIPTHFARVRDNFAKNWAFYGKNPATFNDSVLAEHLERYIWSLHILHALKRFKTEYISKDPEYWQRQPDSINPLLELLDNAIVVRLKELNVVFAETGKGQQDQFKRTATGNSVKPEVYIKDRVDSTKEVGGLKAWAIKYKSRFPYELNDIVLPKAVSRTLPPLIR